METKKFIIDGREYQTYQLSNRQMLDLIKGNEISDDDRKLLMSKVLDRVEYDLCPRCGETNDEVFVRFFSNFVNGSMRSKQNVAEKMSLEHRYLQNEMFMVCMAYITKLAENCERGYYDGRNEYACKTAQKIIDHLNEIDYPY